MKTEDVVKFFGSKVKTAEALGIGRSAVSNWGEFVPETQQYKIQVITKGKLKASPPDRAA